MAVRTPVKQVTGALSSRGDPETTKRLARAFRVSEADGQVLLDGIHAVHPYPGRLHPIWARRLFADLPANTSVVDPFCGAGTSLVEARLRGLHSRGSDINPVAVRLARLRVIPPPPADALRAEAARCAERCSRPRNTPFSALAAGEEGFPRHVLATLIALRDEVQRTPDPRVREVLLFSLSPLLDKFAARLDRPAPRVATGTVVAHFTARVERWIETFTALSGCPWGEAEAADARRLPWKAASSGAALTSPPYAGVFDYTGVQERRARWLAAPDELMQQSADHEIGRRGGGGSRYGAWSMAMGDALGQLSRVLAPGSPCWIVVGDGVEQRDPVWADEVLETICRALPFEFAGVVSQERPHFHRPSQQAFAYRPRREHLLELRRR